MPIATAADRAIPLGADNVHATWSEFTKKKNTRAELTRLENISWRIWHALRISAASGRAAPRFAVHVDAATACIVDPLAAAATDEAGPVSAAGNANALHLFGHHGALPAVPPAHPAFAAPSPSTSPAPAPVATARPPRTYLDDSDSDADRECVFVDACNRSVALPPRRRPPAPSNGDASSPAAPAATAPAPAAAAPPAKPFIVITLPASLLDPAPSLRKAARAARSARGPNSGAISPTSLIKRSSRHVDLSRYFAVASGASAPLAIAAAPTAASSSLAPRRMLAFPTSTAAHAPPVVFVVGSNDCDDELTESDSDDGVCLGGGSSGANGNGLLAGSASMGGLRSTRPAFFQDEDDNVEDDEGDRGHAVRARRASQMSPDYMTRPSLDETRPTRPF
ncbi:hypothetical protein GGF31_000981 [Allomyces arbusculus]|nr:hypothetical protein GGF31_000981 [Allomyces arbusculus]